MTLLLLTALLPLLDDKPPQTDALRFPPAHVCKAQLVACQEFQGYLEARQHLEPWNYWALQDSLAETYRAYRAWDWCLAAQGGFRDYCRRESLKQLREVLGPDLYYAGRMPPAAPPWRMQER